MHRLELTEEPERRVFAVAHAGPYFEIGPAFGRLADLTAEHGLRAAGRELIGIFCDDPDVTAPADLRSHAGIIVGDAAHCPPGLEDVRLAPGRHAVLRLTGPYSGLQPAYVWLFSEGLAGAGVVASSAPSFEIYRNDPSDTPPDDLITDIFVPLA